MAKVPRLPSAAVLGTLVPAVATLASGALVWRLYFRAGRYPTRWNDFRHVGPAASARFDHHEGKAPTGQDRAVLYAAEDPTTCFAEVFQRTRVIGRRHAAPSLVAFETAAAVRLLDLTGGFPTRAGASMALMTSPRPVARNWARAFYEAWPDLAGLCYPSGMYANRRQFVFNERARASGFLPPRPAFHRALEDPSLLPVLKKIAADLGYALR